jgi:hypothetical protein
VLSGTSFGQVWVARIVTALLIVATIWPSGASIFDRRPIIRLVFAEVAGRCPKRRFRVALAVKCSHVLEEAADDFGRKFERGALDHRSPRAARAKEEEGQALELVESALGCGLRVVECLLVAVVD